MTVPTRRYFDEAGAGFRPHLDPACLRRQLRMSLGVILILAAAIAGAATTVGTIPVTRSASALVVPAAPLSADTNAFRAVHG